VPLVLQAALNGDIGVRLDADGHGGIEDIWGTLHYVQPDGSSLMERASASRAAASDRLPKAGDRVAARD
jgi:hypothetical protein